MSHATSTWALTAPVVTITAVGPTTPTAIVEVSFTEANQFGRGVTHPFRRDGKGDFQNLVGAELVQRAVSQILGTKAATEFNQGEIQWRPDFGSKLHLLRHAPNNQATHELARLYSVEAVNRWEPRARITNVNVLSEDPTDLKSLTVAAKFNFIDLNTGAVIFDNLETAIVL